MLLGLIFLGEEHRVVPVVDFSRLWPLILIVLGVGRFVSTTEDGKHRGGLWLIFLGVLFLLHTYGVFTIQESWPLFIVAGGVSILLSRRHTPVPGGDRS